MKLPDILSIEQARADLTQCRTIHFVKEGNFYRAYEWSAWLCFCHITQFKATRRLQNDGQQSFVFIGFPVSSLEKFTAQGEIVQQNETQVNVLLPDTVFPPTATLETLQTDFTNWKNAVPLTEAAKKKQEEEKHGVSREERPQHITDIMRRVVSYPIEQHSPMECMAFLSDIKQALTNII